MAYFNLFRKALRDWLEAIRKSANAREAIETEQVQRPANGCCRACGIGEDAPARNMLVHFQKHRIARVCDKCWPEIERKLPNPNKGPYDDKTVVKFLKLLSNIRREKRHARRKLLTP